MRRSASALCGCRSRMLRRRLPRSLYEESNKFHEAIKPRSRHATVQPGPGTKPIKPFEPMYARYDIPTRSVLSEWRKAERRKASSSGHELLQGNGERQAVSYVESRSPKTSFDPASRLLPERANCRPKFTYPGPRRVLIARSGLLVVRLSALAGRQCKSPLFAVTAQ